MLQSLGVDSEEARLVSQVVNINNSASSLFCPSTGGMFIKQVVKNLLDMLQSLGIDGEEARLVSQLPVLTQHWRYVHQTGGKEPT